MGFKLVCTNCKRKYKFSRWHTRVPTRCQDCGGMLTGDLTAVYRHVVAHPTRYDRQHRHGLRPFAKVAGIAFLFGVLMTAVLITWYRNTQVPRLMTQLSSQDEDVWTEAVEDLVHVGRRAVPALVGAATGEDDTLSQRALSALEKLGDKAVEPLVELLARRDEDLSRSAAGLLPRVSSRQSLPRLKSIYVSQRDPVVRSAVLGAFEKHPDASLLRPLIMSLELPAPDEETEVLNRRIDGLCRKILEVAASEHADIEVPEAPAQLDDWPAWAGEHQEAITTLVKARRAGRESVTEGDAP